MVVSVIPLFARSFGYDEIQIGAISMVAAVTSIISSVPGSLVGQRYGLRFCSSYHKFQALYVP